MRKVALGDRSAFGQLFDRYNQLALNLAARVLNERQEAEDVVQEVFLQVWRDASSYRQERGNVSTWIVAIARIGDDDRPSTIDVPQVPEAARAEIDLRARHAARAEYRQCVVDGVSLADATEIQRDTVSERNCA